MTSRRRVILERYRQRTRRFHAAVYLVTIPLLFTGWWLLVGREGEPSFLALALGQPDTAIHLELGWILAVVALLPPLLGVRGLIMFVRETFRFDKGDVRWVAQLPKASFTGAFARHEGHFDPGQRIANIVIVLSLITVIATGVGLALVPGGPIFVWLHRIHTWATIILTPVLAGHVLIAVGVLPGYRGVWRSMHFGGRIALETTWRVWPGWTERALMREVHAVKSPPPVASPQPADRLH